MCTGRVDLAFVLRALRKGADGVIFVADSQPGRMEANLESLENLDDSIAELQAILAEEARVQGELGALPTHEEGMAAFAEKRVADNDCKACQNGKRRQPVEPAAIVFVLRTQPPHVVAPGAAPDLHEDLLHSIFRVLRGRRMTACETPDQPAVALDALRYRGLIACPDLLE